MSVKLDEPMSEVVKIHEKPYFPNTLTTKQEYILSDYKTMVTHSYQNLLTIDDSQFQTNDLPLRLDFSLRRKIQSLCRGQVIIMLNDAKIRNPESRIFLLLFFFFRFSSFFFPLFFVNFSIHFFYIF